MRQVGLKVNVLDSVEGDDFVPYSFESAEFLDNVFGGRIHLGPECFKFFNKLGLHLIDSAMEEV